MDLRVDALDLNFADSGPLKGLEVAQRLVTSAKQVGLATRKILEASCLADLELFLEDELSRKINMTQIEYIYSAALAGGAYAAENLPSRVRKVSPELSNENLVQICSQIEALISIRKSTIDSIRITVNSVTSIFGELLKDYLISDSDMKKTRLLDLEERRKNLLKRKIANYEEFIHWIDENVILYRQVSEYRSAELERNISTNSNDTKELISAKRKKGFVSTKSIDTYEKRIGDFVAEFVIVNKKQKIQYSPSIRQTIEPFVSYSPNLKSINSVISANFKESSKAKFLDFVNKDSDNASQSLSQELEHFIEDRPIKIVFSNKIMSESIDQVLNSLRAQLASRRTDGKAKHRIGESFLSIEVPGIKKGDIEEIEAVLRLNQKI